MKTTFFIFEVILAVVLSVSVLLQPSKSDGLKGLVQGSSDTFFSRNKRRTREAVLYRVTIVSAILFAVNTLVMNLI